ncbi:MAG: hypothetical protein KDB74_10315 [Flavobacteriales bacterium]|nr:hypothetical protein [Flavobacteriales bacterium]
MKYNSLYRIFVVLFLVICSAYVNAQNTAMIMEMIVTDDGKKMSGAEIQVFRDGRFVEKVLTDGKGRADIPMDKGGVYTISISGNGMVTKKIEVNTKNTPGDLTEPIIYPAEVDIFPKLEGLNYNILNQPIGKIAFNSEYGDFSADEGHTKQMQSELKKLTENYIAKKAQEASNEKEKQKQYDEAIKIADKAFAAEEWEKAEAEYKKAAAILPVETYPSFQLAELKTKLIAIRKGNERYDQAMQAAKQAESAKDIATAIAEYKRASGYKPNEEAPKAKITELQNFLANEAKAEQNYLAAIEKGDNALKASDLVTAKSSFEEATKIKPSESYPKNKLAEINDILAKKLQKETDYNNAIKAGDDALTAKEYEKAKASYQKALGVKPTEKYPTDQIAKVDGLLAESAKKEQDYLAAVELGDNALKANKYDEAKAAFANASKIKPSEEYPKNKIKEIDQFLAENAAKEKGYQEKIAAADKALAAKDYETAKSTYAAAGQIKPTEVYPKDKIKEIDGILAANAEKEKSYNDAIAKGDQALAAKNYEAAKTSYNAALAIKPDEKYPKDKISEIETIVVGQQKIEEEYQAAIKNGDAALAGNKLEDAKKAYLSASSIKPTETYPQDKLKEIDGIIAANAEKESAYIAAITEGDAALKANEFSKSKTAYTKALSLKPEEAYPKAQLKIVDEKKAALEAEKAAAEKLEADYQAAIQSGDKALANKDFSAAKTSFEKAKSLKSEEQYPQDKLKEIAGILAANAEKDANYQKAITEGDKLFASQDYQAAKSAYENALSVKPEESYPKEKLGDIELKLAEIAKKEADAAKLETDYQAAIKLGDEKIAANDLAAATTAFNNAKKLKPSEQYPVDQLAEIQKLQEKLAAEEAEKARLEALQKEYDAAIAKADQLMKAKDLNGARTSYQAALALKPTENYPKTKIEEINSILDDVAKQDQAYQTAIASGDKLFTEEKFEDAKSKYAEASSIKPEENYPKEKISAIETKLAELAAKQEEIRLKNEQAAELDAKFQAAVKEGDAAFKASEFDKAEASYTKALSFKPAETYPQSQLAAIDQKRLDLASKAEQEAAAAAKAELDAKYNAIVKEADDFFKANDFENASAKYNAALGLKSSEEYPKSQLAAIDAKKKDLANKAEQEAAAAAKAELDAKYQGALTEADNAFNAEDFDAAEKGYMKALSFKPSETYPQSQLGLIDAKREEAAALAANEANAAAKAKAAAELDAKYQAAIAEGDAAFNSNQFDAAEKGYMKALSFKPSETYPQSQLGLIDAKKEEIALKLKAEENAKAEAARLAKLEQNYLAAIELGDQKLQLNALNEAKSAFQNALSFKPEEAYPKNKIAEIDALIKAEKELNSKQAAELNAKYQEVIILADQAFSSRALDVAESKYKEAQTYKLDEPYPAKQLLAIEQLKAEKKAREEARKIELEREARNEASYQTAIVEGDQAFNNEDYSSAKSKYELALGLKPSEAYPKSKLAEIQKMLDAQSAALAEEQRKKKEASELASRYGQLIVEGDNAFSKGSLSAAKSSFSQALSIKPDESYPKEQLRLIEAELEKDRLAREEELRKLDEPIQIKKGPVSSINGDAEAEIDKIYQEMWAKKNSDKNAIVEEANKQYLDIARENKEKEEKRRQNALERIEEISVSMELSKEESEEYYMQNYETVIDKEKAIKEVNETWQRESERVRNNVFEDKASQASGEINFNTNRNKEIIEGKNEAIEQIRVNLAEEEKQNFSEQDERILIAKEESEEKLKAIIEYNQGRQEANIDKMKDYAGDELSGWEQTNKRYVSESDSKLEDSKNNIYKKREDERAYAKYLSENQGIEKYQQKVNAQELEIYQFNQQRKDNFKENQQKIEEKTIVLKEETERLNEVAEKNRQTNSNQEFYMGADLPKQSRLAEKYPQGVTEEIIENQNNSTTLRRIVVKGTEVDIYEKTLYTWGGVFYTKNGDNITKEDWDTYSK